MGSSTESISSRTFGASGLGLRLGMACGGFLLPRSRKEARRRLRDLCPLRPGVYGMYDDRGELVYVGKSKRLRHRLLTYFHSAAKDAKAGQIIQQTERIVWEPGPHEFTALLRELELIRRHQPRFNVQGQPGRYSKTFVCLGRSPAPYVYLSDAPHARALACYGPLRSRAMLGEAARQLNTWFRLRDCPDRVPMVFADQRTLFDDARSARCPRLDLGSCLAPCAAGCTVSEYDEQLAAAQAFLEGENLKLLERLQSGMASASAARLFEKAALYRDVWSTLDWLADRLQRLRSARGEFSFVYSVSSNRGRRYWIALRQGQVVAGARAPVDERSARNWQSRLQRLYAPDREVPPPQWSEDLEVLMLVVSWFRQRPRELARAMPVVEAERICRELRPNGVD